MDIAPYHSGLAVLYTVPAADLQDVFGELASPEDLAREVAAGFLVFDGARPCPLVDVQSSNSQGDRVLAVLSALSVLPRQSA
jgi:hypothetical protein